MRPTRITNLNIGVNGIDRWRKDDEVHLPDAVQRGVSFLPETTPLDEILRPPTLDERLAGQLVPRFLSPDLLEPTVMSATRQSLKARLDGEMMAAEPGARSALAAASALLETEAALDAEISEALAVLLRG